MKEKTHFLLIHIINLMTGSFILLINKLIAMLGGCLDHLINEEVH